MANFELMNVLIGTILVGFALCLFLVTVALPVAYFVRRQRKPRRTTAQELPFRRAELPKLLPDDDEPAEPGDGQTRGTPMSYPQPMSYVERMAAARAAVQGASVYAGSSFLRSGPLSRLAGAQAGRAGEERVVEQLAERLDHRWAIFCNVDLGDRKGDIDLVLIGPGGIFALEVKSYSGSFRVENGSWYKQTDGGNWARMRRGPGAQARSNAARLCEYLKDKGMERGSFVQPVVVLSQELPVEVMSSGTAVWRWNEIAARLDELKAGGQLSKRSVDQVVEALQKTVPHGGLVLA